MSRDIELQAVAQQVLKPKRYEHVLRVVETSELLAKRFGADVEAAKTAAYLHDIAKHMSDEELQEILEAGGENRYLDYHRNIWHAPVGAILAKQKYQVTDGDVLAAIKNHCTGRSGMSLVEEVVFLADYMEPGRTQPGVEAVRALAETSLQKAIWRTLDQTVSYLEASNRVVHPDMLEALAYYREIIGVDEPWKS